jgi:hypothetical protein
LPKGVEAQQLSNSGTAGNLANTLTGNAAGLYGGLNNQFQAEAAHPSGYTPSQIATQNTAAQQSAGGSQAATAGQGGLYAARTKNAGAAQNAIGAGTRAAGANLSNAALGVANKDANLEQTQRQEGLAGLGGLYGEDLSGGEKALGLSNEALSGAASSSEDNPWMKLLLQGLQTGGQVAEAICPAMGSLYLIADGTEKPVEDLRVGDFIAGVDGEMQSIEEIQTGRTQIIKVTTDNGYVARNSKTHAYSLPMGGFAVASRSLGKNILTKDGASRVISVEPDGMETVYNIITDGSHTYRADGIWSVGVGDAERLVSMEVWDDRSQML